MTQVYDARWSFYPLRPENNQTASTKYRRVDLYGKLGCAKFSGIFHHVVVVCFVPEFSPQRGRFPSSGKIKLEYKTTRGRGQKKSKTRI